MKKRLRILSLLMTLVMTVSLCAGCAGKGSDSKAGKETKESGSVFKELKEASSITKGKTSQVISLKAKFDDTETVSEFSTLLEGQGITGIIDTSSDTIEATIKIDTNVVSTTEVSATISAKVGTADYVDVTTFIYKDDVVYFDAASIINFIKVYMPTEAAELESGLSQMGIQGYASINLTTLMSSMGDDVNMDAFTVEGQEEYVNSIIGILEKYFEKFSETKSDGYELEVNKGNYNEWLNVIKEFINSKDLDTIYTSTIDLASGLGEVSSEEIEETKNQDLTEYKEQAIQAIDNNMVTITESMEKYNPVINYYININGEEGKREGNMKLSGTFSVEDESAGNVQVECTLDSEIDEDGATSVDEIIPTDAMDITSMLVMMLNSNSATYDASSFNDLSF